MKQLSIDLETFSSIPVAKSGAYKYIQSPDFEILLLAYSVDNSPVEVIDLAQGESIPQWLCDAIKSPEYVKHAYNASFEWYCLSKYFGETLPIEQWRDTMLHALYCGFPASLEKAGQAIGLSEEKQKLTVGKSLIRYFCVPCKPTKSNSGRTRNFPKHDLDKWELFKKYCIGDVVTEMEIERKLSNFPVPEDIQKQWQTDCIINSRGVAADMEFVKGALQIATESNENLMAEAVSITGLENPNSVSQLSKWLESEGNLDIADLRKDTVSRMLKGNLVKGDAERMLEIRQELGKTSTKKYNAIENTICEDGRIRGLLQFYGANRTGRFAGRLVQVQNLPRTYIDIKYLPLAREIVKQRKGEQLKVLFGSIQDTLSQLIRTSFIASESNVLVDADFSSIEARVVAWLAKEEWKIQAFNEGKDVYCETASAMFGVPVVKHGENSELRQKGKIAELACIAEGQLVLTDKGLVPIEKITLNHKLWDGKEWVSHEGVVYRGKKEVIEYEGLTATPDHLVWIEGQSQPIHFGNAATCGAHLAQTGNGRTAIRLGKNHKFGKTLEQKLESLLCFNTVYGLRYCAMAKSRQSTDRKIKRLSKLFTTASNTKMAGQEIDCRKTTLRKSERFSICQLRAKRNKILFLVCLRSWLMDYQESRITQSRIGIGQDKQQRQLRGGELEICDSQAKQLEQTNNRFNKFQSSRLSLCLYGSYPQAVTRIDEIGNNRIGKESGYRKTQKLAHYRGKVKVYDIRNAGQHNRFTVSNKLVHNCGYGGSVGALVAMGALDMGIPEEDLQDIVDRWRGANRNIVNLWYKVESAAIQTIKTGKATAVNNLIFARETDYNSNLDFLTITLPSGRKLFYAQPEICENQWGKPSIVFQGVNQTTKQWTALETFGGKLVENCVQAISRDCLTIAIERLEESGFPIVFHVHDEVVIDCPKDKANLEKVVEIMTAPIDWAEGLPINADGWVGDFFRKD